MTEQLSTTETNSQKYVPPTMEERKKDNTEKPQLDYNSITTATFDEVKKKFRILVLKYHPDKCKDKRVGEEKFKEIFEAYETIKKSVMTSNA